MSDVTQARVLRVPFVDLTEQIASLRAEIDDALGRVVSRASFVLGPELESLELEFASYIGAEYAIGVASGTDALELALRALDVGAGDEVITVANTFAATAFAITATGATPVFVDVDPGTLLMSPIAVEEALTSHTRAIVPVHLYGQCTDMTAICRIAAQRGIAVVEDACQAHGARFGDRLAGSIGDLGCFSFYPSKNLGAMGDAGIVVTGSRRLADRVRLLRNYGSGRRYYHEQVGFNRRLDEVQAAVLRVKLPHLDEWNAARREIANRYCARLGALEGIISPQPPFDDQSMHLFVVRCQRRDELCVSLEERGVATAIHYPLPLHRQGAYAPRKSRSLPVTEQAADEILSLPMYPELSADAVDYVCDQIAAYVHERADSTTVE